jgi:radical SAM protein with 4Fe4S-binding SPASM domain
VRSPLFLQSDAQLDLDPGGPRLYRLGKDRPKHDLTIGEAIALSILAAGGELASAKSCCGEVFGQDSGAALVDHVVDRFWTYLGDGRPRALDVAWLADVRKDRLRLPSRRQAAPTAVTWLVTLGCNRKCPYCFYDVTQHAAGRRDSPRDATFPLDDATRIVAEMAEIGASDLYLTGGEPLLRKDIVEIIAEASRRRVRVRVVTKYAVTAEFAHELAEAGLYAATVSLDDARPHVASALAGAPGYLEEAEGAIRAFIGAGIPLKVNAVVSRVNQDSLGDLAERLIALGVPELAISPYVRPQAARTNVLQLAPPSGSFFGDVAKLKDRCGDRLRIEAGGSAIPDGLSERACGRHVDCDVGIDALDVLPDGRVTRCRYLPNEEALIVGDLKTQSLMDVWDGAALARFRNPTRSEYGNTLCSDCGGFEACNSRGRCYFTALAGQGRLHAPDIFCKNPLLPILQGQP